MSRWYIEFEKNPEGCIHDDCDQCSPGYLALRFAPNDNDTDGSFEVAVINGGGYAEESVRELLAKAVGKQEPKA